MHIQVSKRNINKIIKFIIVSIFACTSFIYVYNIYNREAIDAKRQKIFFNNNNYDSINKKTITMVQVNHEDDNYELVIEIPKLNLKKGIYNINSKYNNVNKNIMLIKNSKMPDVKNSNLILASHSGNSSISYFKNLDKLTFGDEIIIYYKGYKYIYKFNNYYKQDKTGSISISRNINTNALTLITCDKTNKNYQLVFISYIKNIEKF